VESGPVAATTKHQHQQQPGTGDTATLTRPGSWGRPAGAGKSRHPAAGAELLPRRGNGAVHVHVCIVRLQR
jgi:hypothetical protein